MNGAGVIDTGLSECHWRLAKVAASSFFGLCTTRRSSNVVEICQPVSTQWPTGMLSTILTV